MLISQMQRRTNTNQLHSITMNRCANHLLRGLRKDHSSCDKRASLVGAVVAFAGSVIFTLAAASALATGDLPLPLF